MDCCSVNKHVVVAVEERSEVVGVVVVVVAVVVDTLGEPVVAGAAVAVAVAVAAAAAERDGGTEAEAVEAAAAVYDQVAFDGIADAAAVAGQQEGPSEG